MDARVPQSPVSRPDSQSGWPESHGSWAGLWVDVLPVGDGSCLLPGDEEAPNLIVGGRLVFGPGQRRHVPHTAAADFAAAAEGVAPDLAAPAPGPAVVAGSGVPPGGEGGSW